MFKTFPVKLTIHNIFYYMPHLDADAYELKTIPGFIKSLLTYSLGSYIFDFSYVLPAYQIEDLKQYLIDSADLIIRGDVDVDVFIKRIFDCDQKIKIIFQPITLKNNKDLFSTDQNFKQIKLSNYKLTLNLNQTKDLGLSLHLQNKGFKDNFKLDFQDSTTIKTEGYFKKFDKEDLKYSLGLSLDNIHSLFCTLDLTKSFQCVNLSELFHVRQSINNL